MSCVKPTSTKSVYVAPIAKTLKNIRFWLTREENSSLIIAESTVKELKQQDLPQHIRIKN